jgi:DNA-binding HxlR family transcriptional regulator
MSGVSTSLVLGCSIARGDEIFGLKWVALILSEAMAGRTRFVEFRELGVSPDVLSDRLTTLVASGLLEKRPYRLADDRAREEYVLTQAGRDSVIVLAALSDWSDKHRSRAGQPFTHYYDRAGTRPLRLAFLDPNGNEVVPAAVTFQPLTNGHDQPGGSL